MGFNGDLMGFNDDQMEIHVDSPGLMVIHVDSMMIHFMVIHFMVIHGENPRFPFML